MPNWCAFTDEELSTHQEVGPRLSLPRNRSRTTTTRPHLGATGNHVRGMASVSEAACSSRRPGAPVVAVQGLEADQAAVRAYAHHLDGLGRVSMRVPGTDPFRTRPTMNADSRRTPAGLVDGRSHAGRDPSVHESVRRSPSNRDQLRRPSLQSTSWSQPALVFRRKQFTTLTTWPDMYATVSPSSRPGPARRSLRTRRPVRRESPILSQVRGSAGGLRRQRRRCR